MIGEQVGNFQIISQLGKGGMGEVYLAEHASLGTRVAIKMLLPHVSADVEHVQRFFNEAIAVGSIQHAGTGKIFDSGSHAGRAYLVMEYLAGETLAARIRRLQRLPIAQVGEVGKQIAGVLEAVHRAGITHRDLKPDNIFIVPDDELGERIKIVDFGIAKLSTISGGMTATGTGALGTPAYMSPEQWRNAKTVDWRADAYSLGCLTFEMITGRPPFFAETIGEACSKHLTEEPPRLASVAAVPPELDELIARMLEKDPTRRPASMRDIANAFAAIAATSPIELAATQPSGHAMAPVQAAIGATQVTGLGDAPGPTVKLSEPAPPPSTTTLAGASAQLDRSQRRGVSLWLALGLGAGLAAAIAVIVATRGPAAPEPIAEPAPALSSAPVDAATPTRSPGSGSAVATPPKEIEAGSGSGVSITPLREPQRPIAPRPNKGLIVITSDAKVELFLDGKPIGSTPRNIEVDPGEYRVLAKLRESVTKDRRFVVRGGDTHKHAFIWDRSSAPSQLVDRLDQNMIRDDIHKAAWHQIHQCKQRDPNKHGLVFLRLDVKPDGTVGPVVVSDSPSEALTNCVVNVIRSVKIRSSKRGGHGALSYAF